MSSVERSTDDLYDFCVSPDVLMEVGIPQKCIQDLNADALPKDWADRLDITRTIGDAWCRHPDRLALRMPSVVIGQEYNYLIHPHHPNVKDL